MRIHSGRAEVANVAHVARILEFVRSVPGHIAEFGVGSGGNALVMSTLIKDVFHWENVQYLGFDTFAGYSEEILHRNPSFNRDAFSSSECSLESVDKRLRAAGLSDVSVLVKGDLRDTVPALVEKPLPKLLSSAGGLALRLLYIDCNDFNSALVGLTCFHDVLSPGALVVIDERRLGGETGALLAFGRSHQESYNLVQNPGFPGRVCLKKVF